MTKLSCIVGKDRVLITLCCFAPAIWPKLRRMSRVFTWLLAEEGLKAVVRRVGEKLQLDNMVMAHGDALAELCERGNTDVVWLLLLRGHSVSKRDAEGATLLQRAVHSGSLPVLCLLMEKGAGINAKGTYGYTPLHECCYLGAVPSVQFLLRMRANVDALSKSGSTPLLVASREGHATVVELLLAAGGDADDGGDKGWTPLAVAAGEGHESICRILLDAKADVNGWPDGMMPGQPTALELAEKCGHSAVCELLRSRGGIMTDTQPPMLPAMQSGQAPGPPALMVQIPEGLVPGDVFQIQSPAGPLQATVPHGVSAGQVVAIPYMVAQAGTVPQQQSLSQVA